MLEQNGNNNPRRPHDAPPAPTRTVDGTHVRRRNWAGEPTLLLGEDARGYDELLAQVSRVLVPRDVIEDMWIRDVVDLAWDVLRLRRLKANLLRVRAREALREVLDPLSEDAFALARGWFAHDAAAVEEVERALKSAGLSMDRSWQRPCARSSRRLSASRQ